MSWITAIRKAAGGCQSAWLNLPVITVSGASCMSVRLRVSASCNTGYADDVLMTCVQ